MSNSINPPEVASGHLPPNEATPQVRSSRFLAGPGDKPLSPTRRAWQRFRRNRLGFVSLVIFCALLLLSLCAELVSNDRPLVVVYQGQTYFPMWKDYPEATFGGDFATPTDYLDPFIRKRLAEPGNWAVFAPNAYGFKTINYFAESPNPSGPSAANWLGTDDRGVICWPS